MNTRQRLLMLRAMPAVLVLAGLLGFPATSTAQTYPDHAIKMVVPFGAGTSTDAVARMVGEELSKLAQVPVVIENIPGANGILGVQAVSRAAPDGYTIMMTTSTTHAANTALFKKLPYDPIKDFEPITKVVEQTIVLVVRPDSPYRTIGEFMAAVKAGKAMTFAGSSASTRVASEMLKSRLKGNLLHVPYKSAPQALTDLIGGQVDFMSVDPTTALPLIRGGKLRALSVSSLRRDPLLPDVPTLSESGLKGFELTSWGAVFAPAGTPAKIVEQLNAWLRQALQSPGLRDRLVQNAYRPIPSSSQELRAFVESESAKWAKVIQDAGIERE